MISTSQFLATGSARTEIIVPTVSENDVRTFKHGSVPRRTRRARDEHFVFPGIIQSVFYPESVLRQFDPETAVKAAPNHVYFLVLTDKNTRINGIVDADLLRGKQFSVIRPRPFRMLRGSDAYAGI